MWVIVALACLVVLFCFLLWVPLDMMLRADLDGKPKVRLKFRWLFGLIGREIIGEKEKPEKERIAAKGKKKRRWVDAGVMFRILRTRDLLRHTKELVKDVFSCLNLRDMVADFTVGLGDPADTGLLFAFIGPATVFMGSSNRHQIRIEPSFGDDAILQGYSQGTVRLRPIRLVPPFLKFAFSITTIRLAGVLIKSKWKRKR